MHSHTFRLPIAVLTAAALAAPLLVARPASAHCDSLDGPVVVAAREAIGKGDVTLVLRWVRADDEPVIRAAFDRTLKVRKAGADAAELADTWFFETLVRVHRAGEGAPYTGLKPAGRDPGAAVRAVDDALDGGSGEELVALVTDVVADRLRARYAHAAEARAHAGESVEQGRAAVAAYVELAHYAERLYKDAAGPAHHAHGGAAGTHAGGCGHARK